jgi:hypothetical protein
MISVFARVLKENKSFLIVLVVLIIAGISIISNNISEDSNLANRDTPVSAPTAPSTPNESTSESPSEAPQDNTSQNEQDIVQSDQIDQLMLDAAADTAMAVVSIGFEMDYQIGPQDRLSILRSMVSEDLLNKFSLHYSKDDWDKVFREKIQIFVEILEVEARPEISTGYVIMEVVVEYLDGARNPVKSSNPSMFEVRLERTYDFNIWHVTSINFK